MGSVYLCAESIITALGISKRGMPNIRQMHMRKPSVAPESESVIIGEETWRSAAEELDGYSFGSGKPLGQAIARVVILEAYANVVVVVVVD